MAPGVDSAPTAVSADVDPTAPVAESGLTDGSGNADEWLEVLGAL